MADNFWREHWAERSELHYELAVGGRASNRPSEFLQMVGAIVRGLKLGREDVLLDAGCANGLVALALSPWVREIWACDYVPGMVSQARSLVDGNRNLYFLGADIRRLPFRSPLFSKVLLVSVIQYLENLSDVQQVFASLGQVMRRGGAVWVGWIPDGDRKGEYLRQIDRMEIDDESRRSMIERNERAIWPTRAQLEAIGRAAGFQVQIQTLAGSAWQRPFMFDAVLAR